MRASTPGVDRLARCESLLAWLEREGCEHAVRVGESSGASVGVFASRDVKRGEALIRCPVACAMTARDTRPSPDDDDATAAFKAALDAARPRLDDAQRLRLFLLRERRLSENPPERPGPPPGRWASYARSLPGTNSSTSFPSGGPARTSPGASAAPPRWTAPWRKEPSSNVSSAPRATWRGSRR